MLTSVDGFDRKEQGLLGHFPKLIFCLFGCCTGRNNRFNRHLLCCFHRLHFTHPDWIFMKEGQKVLQKCLQSKTALKKKRDEGFYLLFFIIAKPLPVVELFVVKDDWTAFSCDFTQAFGFAVVLSFLHHQWRKGGWRNENETRPKFILSLAICFNDKNLVTDRLFLCSYFAVWTLSTVVDFKWLTLFIWGAKRTIWCTFKRRNGYDWDGLSMFDKTNELYWSSSFLFQKYLWTLSNAWFE